MSDSIESRDHAAITLELHEMQGGILHPRPSPYVGTYLLPRGDDRRDGRTLVRKLSGVIASAAALGKAEAWVNVAITFEGLRALGVPQASLDSFPAEFKEGMAARAELLGD